MIHYFNPGHEVAILRELKHYLPPKMAVKMQEDLALLPAWYASSEDYVLVGHTVHAEKRKNSLHLAPCNFNLSPSIHLSSFDLQPSPVELWSISPQSTHYFETLNRQYGFRLQTPAWKEEYRFLGSRFASQKALASLMEAIPEIDKTIFPQFYSTIEEIACHCGLDPQSFAIEQEIAGESEWRLAMIESKEAQFLLKSPYSSSGRGLLWLSTRELSQSERQIISGMLKKQSQVSLEKALGKQLDFSMHFEITPKKEARFIGYSVFQTNGRGAYESSLLAGQEVLEKQITAFIDKNLLQKVQETLTGILTEMYTPYYTGNLGVDMLVYFSDDQFLLHPCVEINMRKSMGYLAIRLFENRICPTSQGRFFVEYHKTSHTLNEKHLVLQKRYPLKMKNNRICSGYLNLCPITETTNYLAYIILA